MGKRKVGLKKKPKKGIDNLKNVASSDEEQLENNLEAILDDEIDSYNTYKEQSLKQPSKGKKRRQQPDSDEEKEVFGLDLSSDDEGIEEQRVDLSGSGDKTGSEEDDVSEDDDNDEDVLGGDDHGYIPDSHAWGRKARLYHNTDYVDQDFGGFEGSDAELAEQEEAEAKEIQKRLMTELDEDDFSQFVPPKAEKSKKVSKSGTREVLKVDFESMSVGEKRKMVQRECPEVIHMLDEYKEKLGLCKKIKELMTQETSELITEFYQTKYHTIMNYCINISFYLYLRSSKPSSCTGHPVIKRILQFRRLLDELELFKPEKVRKAISQGKKITKIPSKSTESPTSSKTLQKSIDRIDDEKIEESELIIGDNNEKRRITYEMSKNKGLTPARSKAQRNPRVKHRLKYRKATIRRKGQVRTTRTEITKYDGEMSGIKSHLTKSIKFK